MSIYQTLGLLIVIILIVWWALRRSAVESDKETLNFSGHDRHGEHEHVEIQQEPGKTPEPVVLEAALVIPSVPTIETDRAPEAIPAVEVKPDDLVVIEGIGPRISGVLKSAGIKTFAQLAEMKPEQIKETLTTIDERLGRISDPTTWPQQAALAARGEMQALQALQDNLKAGRKE